MKIRLTGLPAEIATAIDRLRSVLDVIEDSGPYQRRGTTRQVSHYLDIRL